MKIILLEFSIISSARSTKARRSTIIAPSVVTKSIKTDDQGYGADIYRFVAGPGTNVLRNKVLYGCIGRCSHDSKEALDILFLRLGLGLTRASTQATDMPVKVQVAGGLYRAIEKGYFGA